MGAVWLCVWRKTAWLLTNIQTRIRKPDCQGENMSVLLCSEIFKRATPIGKVRKIVGIEGLPVRAAICTEGADVGVTILRKKRGTVNSLWQTMFAECNLTIQGIIAALKMVNLSPRDSKKTWFCSLLFLCNGIHCTVNSPKSQDTSLRLTFPKNGHLQSVPAYWPFEVQNPMTIGQCCV